VAGAPIVFWFLRELAFNVVTLGGDNVDFMCILLKRSEFDQYKSSDRANSIAQSSLKVNKLAALSAVGNYIVEITILVLDRILMANDQDIRTPETQRSLGGSDAPGNVEDPVDATVHRGCGLPVLLLLAFASYLILL